MKKELITLSNHLDTIGLKKEADYLDSILEKLASSAFEHARYDLKNKLLREAASKLVDFAYSEVQSSNLIEDSMLDEFTEDVIFKLKSLLQQLTEDMRMFGKH